MLNEAIQAVGQLAVEASRAAQARIIKIPGDERRLFVDTAGTGGWEVRETPPPPRQHTLTTVEDLIALATRARDELGFTPSVWHADDGLTLMFADGDGRDRARLPLVHSPQFLRLHELGATPKPMEQRELITLLRVDLAGSSLPPKLLSSVKQIKFRKSETGHSHLEGGNESLGRQVEAEVSGLDGIPDRVTASVLVYTNVGEDDLSWPIECDLDIDVHRQRFLFRPLPDELQSAVRLHQGEIRQRLLLGLDGIPVYAGRP